MDLAMLVSQGIALHTHQFMGVLPILPLLTAQRDTMGGLVKNCYTIVHMSLAVLAC